MKRNLYLCVVLLSGTGFYPATARAEQDVTNRLTVSARLGFNISAQFKGFSLGAPSAPRSTPPQPGRPSGDLYNYDDGYVLTDVSGNAGGQTWYWGYDNSASQISGNSILLNRSTAGALPASGSLESDPNPGVELTYNRELVRRGQLHLGVEAAVNYMNFSVQDNRSTLTRVTDAYAFTPGTTPPTATIANPYQGSYMGPGFVIGATPASSTTSTIGQRRFDSDIWGLRLGPYLETPLGKHLGLSISGGLAVGLLDSSASYVQASFTSGGGRNDTTVSGSDFDVLYGGYAAVNLSWQINNRWSASGGVQFQYLGTYGHSFKGQQVELDLRNSIFVTLGIGYSF